MPNNIILIGPMGAGKTTVGKKLSKLLNFTFVDIDDEMVSRLGVSIQTIFDTEGEAGFRQRELTMLQSVLSENEQSVIATGGGCILTPECRQLIQKQRLVIHLDVGLEQQYERVRKDKRRPILQGGVLSEKLQKLRAERHEIYQLVADFYWLTDNKGFSQLTRAIRKKLDQ